MQLRQITFVKFWLDVSMKNCDQIHIEDDWRARMVGNILDINIVRSCTKKTWIVRKWQLARNLKYNHPINWFSFINCAFFVKVNNKVPVYLSNLLLIIKYPVFQEKYQSLEIKNLTVALTLSSGSEVSFACLTGYSQCIADTSSCSFNSNWSYSFGNWSFICFIELSFSCSVRL